MNLARLDGRIREGEGLRLQSLASRVPSDQAIVELGSYRGKSTCYMASKAQAHIYAVDLWDLGGQKGNDSRLWSSRTWLKFNRQISPYRDRITAIKGRTADVAAEWQRPVGLLFIDADHSYGGCRADYEAWEPHLVSGGVIAFHDYADPWPGVQRTINQHVIPSKKFVDTFVDDRLWIGVKR